MSNNSTNGCNVRIKSDGTPAGTVIFVGDSPILGVCEVRMEPIEPNGSFVKAHLVIEGVILGSDS